MRVIRSQCFHEQISQFIQRAAAVFTHSHFTACPQNWQNFVILLGGFVELIVISHEGQMPLITLVSMTIHLIFFGCCAFSREMAS